MSEKSAPLHSDAVEEEQAPNSDAQQASTTPQVDAPAKEHVQDEDDEGSQSTDLTHQQQKYKWYKCQADSATYGEGHFYWTQIETGESSWTEPNEPYWIWNTETSAIDPAGLQFPGTSSSTSEQIQESQVPANYQGYNPKIHGNYDPNADYAKFHTRQQVPDTSDHTAPIVPHQLADGDAAAYASTMVLNRFSGATQTGDQGPERHSDAAKSARQMNAFFDVDAAANAHEGRSLRAERQAQKFSKQQIKEFNAKRAEKKHKKRMQQLLN